MDRTRRREGEGWMDGGVMDEVMDGLQCRIDGGRRVDGVWCMVYALPVMLCLVGGEQWHVCGCMVPDTISFILVPASHTSFPLSFPSSSYHWSSDSYACMLTAVLFTDTTCTPYHQSPLGTPIRHNGELRNDHPTCHPTRHFDCHTIWKQLSSLSLITHPIHPSDISSNTAISPAYLDE